jgi:ribonuclease HI
LDARGSEAWTVFCDGSWGTFGAGAAAVLVAPSKVRTCYVAWLDFSCTNNIAEYEALLLGLRKLRAIGIRRAILKTDSQVISGHVDKSCKARDPKLENIWIQFKGWRFLSKVFLSRIFQEVKMSMQIC